MSSQTCGSVFSHILKITVIMPIFEKTCSKIGIRLGFNCDYGKRNDFFDIVDKS